MTSFVLIHGGAHGAWCWDRIVPLLQSGPGVDEVVAVDLPGHGTRLAVKPLDEITLADFVAAVVREIEERDLRDVILVGHSLGGLTITAAAERVATRLRRLVYLSTVNPATGKSVEDVMRHPLSPLARGVELQQMFCNDLDAETAAWLLGNLGPEPAGPMREPVSVAQPPAGVAATYILLERDEALTPELQREQARTLGVADIVSFDAGHSAFASRPRELAELLLGYA